MPKAKKQKNGSWRCQISVGDEYIDGKRKQHVKSFTAATKAEAEDMASEYRRIHAHVAPQDTSMTLSEAISRYISSKSNVLSPSTIRGYTQASRGVLEPLGSIPVRKIDSRAVQTWVNTQAEEYSPKTIKNGLGLLTAACSACDPAFRVSVTLPKAPRKDFYIPSAEEVQSLIKAAQNPNIKKAIMLSAYGSLRRGELCALTAEDIDFEGHWISVSKDMVQTEDGEFVVKNIPKTLESCRRIPVPGSVTEELRSGLITCSPNAISRAFEHTVKACDLPHIRFHDLRHFFASYLHSQGVPDVYIEKYGGWKAGSPVMKQIYRNIINQEEVEQADRIRGLFFR